MIGIHFYFTIPKGSEHQIKNELFLFTFQLYVFFSLTESESEGLLLQVLKVCISLFVNLIII
jgi:hypothetical protein